MGDAPAGAPIVPEELPYSVSSPKVRPAKVVTAVLPDPAAPARVVTDTSKLTPIMTGRFRIHPRLRLERGGGAVILNTGNDRSP